ncbi:MAG: alpha/beta hydrolase [Halovenus sp.]
MRTGGIPRDGQELTADDWPTAAEREYAQLQTALADHYGVGIASHALDVDDVGPVHYLEAGNSDGDPVLLLHGLSATAATWLPIVPALADAYRLVIPDRPGRGLSAPVDYHGRDLRRFLTAYLDALFGALDIGRTHVVGSSLGGLQAFLFTLDYDRTDRLCLVGGPGGLTRDLPLVPRLLTVRGLNRILYWLTTRGDPVETTREQLARIGVADDSAIPELYYETWAAGAGLPGRFASVKSYNEAVGRFGRIHPLYDITDEVVTIANPTAYIWGTEDYYFDPEVGRPVAERMPNATFHTLEDHGHIPFLEPTDEAERLVRSFLDG